MVVEKCDALLGFLSVLRVDSYNFGSAVWPLCYFISGVKDVNKLSQAFAFHDLNCYHFLGYEISDGVHNVLAMFALSHAACLRNDCESLLAVLCRFTCLFLSCS